MTNSLIIKDCIDRDYLLLGISEFFAKRSLSVAYLDMSKVQGENVFMEIFALTGDFCINLSIYSVMDFNVEELAVFICNFFNTSALIGNNDDNPFSWNLITKVGNQGVIYQSTEDTDSFFLQKNE